MNTNVLETIVRDYAKPIATVSPLLEVPEKVFSFEEDYRDQVKSRKMLHEFGKDYKLIDLSFLKMRNKDGMPKFAVFGLTNKTCYFKVECTKNDVKFSSNIREDFIEKYFADIFERVGKQAIAKMHSYLSDISVTLLSKFDGLVPEPVRAKINIARPKMDSIYLIKEATNWSLEQQETKLPPAPDPLIVGVEGEFAFLIERFDLTTLENYVSKEFV